MVYVRPGPTAAPDRCADASRARPRLRCSRPPPPLLLPTAANQDHAVLAPLHCAPRCSPLIARRWCSTAWCWLCRRRPRARMWGTSSCTQLCVAAKASVLGHRVVAETHSACSRYRFCSLRRRRLNLKAGATVCWIQKLHFAEPEACGSMKQH